MSQNTLTLQLFFEDPKYTVSIELNFTFFGHAVNYIDHYDRLSRATWEAFK